MAHLISPRRGGRGVRNGASQLRNTKIAASTTPHRAELVSLRPAARPTCLVSVSALEGYPVKKPARVSAKEALNPQQQYVRDFARGLRKLAARGDTSVPSETKIEVELKQRLREEVPALIERLLRDPAFRERCFLLKPVYDAIAIEEERSGATLPLAERRKIGLEVCALLDEPEPTETT